jgi:hypothetical protein
VRNPLRQSFTGKVQRLLNLGKGGVERGSDQPPSPLPGQSPMRSRSFNGSLEHFGFANALRASAPETPPRDKGGVAGGAVGTSALAAPATAGKQGRSIWGKLGSGMKPRPARKAAPATVAMLPSLDGPSVELPVPSNGSDSASALCRVNTGGAGDDGASYDPHADGDAVGGVSCDDSLRSCSPGPGTGFDAGPSPYMTRGGYYDETVDLRQVCVLS